jgi:hypothetical protein
MATNDILKILECCFKSDKKHKHSWIWNLQSDVNEVSSLLVCCDVQSGKYLPHLLHLAVEDFN